MSSEIIEKEDPPVHVEETTAKNQSEATTAAPEPGSSLTLPISRIKRVLKLDPEHISSTESANYLLGAATELFLMNLTEKAVFNAKTNKRKKVMYSDFNQVVSSNDNLLFLKDLVPKTAPLKDLIEGRKIRLNTKDSAGDLVTNGAVAEGNDDTLEEPAELTPVKKKGGQQTLNFFKKITNEDKDINNPVVVVVEDDDDEEVNDKEHEDVVMN